MSAIKTTTLRDPSDNDVPVNTVFKCTPKAFCHFDGTGSAGSWEITSFNTASYIDRGVGVYETHWTNVFTNGDYIGVGNADGTDNLVTMQSGNCTASFAEMYNRGVEAPGYEDTAHTQLLVVGDLA